MQDAKAYADATGKQLIATHVVTPSFFGSLGFMHPGPNQTFVYQPESPPEGTTARVAAPTCPTCGDPLQGQYGTFCPRCDWSEDNTNLDSDPLSNPPDPTVDMHRGIQARTLPSHRWAKWFAAVEDM